MLTLGEQLKICRQKKKLSLRKVYEVTGITDSKLSRIERSGNTTDITADNLVALARLYEINPVNLFVSAGYIKNEDLLSYVRIFRDVELLNDDERALIQKQIDLFTKERK